MASEQRTRVVESRDMVGGGGWGKSLQAAQDYILVWGPMSFCGAERGQARSGRLQQAVHAAEANDDAEAAFMPKYGHRNKNH